MLRNKIDSTLTQENEDLVIQNIGTAEATLDFLTDLRTEERMAMPKMSKKALDFVERALMHAKDHPDMVPPFMSIESMERDLTLLKQVQRINGLTERFAEKLRDTHLQLGSEVYATARDFYRTAKSFSISGLEGAQFVAKDLGYYYKKQFNKTEKPEQVPVVEATSTLKKKKSG